MTYAFDSNIVAYLLRDEGNVRQRFREEISDAKNLYALPLIVVYEVKRWLLYKPTKIQREFAKEFDNLFDNVRRDAEMSIPVWEKAVDIHILLRQEGKLIADSDILIAAYCMVNDYTLVTRNTKDFNRIDGLKLANWY